MALGDYEGPAKIYVEGRILAECERSTVRVSANSNKVYTMQRHLAGRSRGPTETEISLENAVPKKGYEREFHKHLENGDYVRVVVDSGGRRFQVDCWVEDYELTNAVDASAKYNATLMGGPPEVR